jgi:RNA polymerase sigma-70 factor, ECF subfamily
MVSHKADQHAQYADIVATYGPALSRLASGYERDPMHKADLLQEIHVALWQSLSLYDARCSLRTWVYRVAHNVAVSHCHRQKRQRRDVLVDIDDINQMPSERSLEQEADRNQTRLRLLTMIQHLKMPDRQIMLLYLEDVDAASIGEIIGMSPGAVATKIHRIKSAITKQFQSEGSAND